MEDRFKFRAWDIEEKQICNVTGWADDMNGRLCEIYGHSTCDNTECYLINPLTKEALLILMQCTGLKDKNGKLIFEGDVLQIETKDSNHKIPNQEVYYNVKRAGFGGRSKENDNALDTCLNYALSWEIIGNIWENSELLKH